MEIFENGKSSYSHGRAKKEVFKHDDVMPRFKARSSAHTIQKRFVWMQIFLNTEKKNLRFRKYPATCGWSNTIQKRYVWTQIFFKYGGKILRFRKYPATCGRGLTKEMKGAQTAVSSTAAVLFVLQIVSDCP